ncbi:MAG: VCBS repeat-containing protein, partial [Desulfobacterales bacterium]
MNKKNVLNILRYVCLMCVLIIGLVSITGSGGGGGGDSWVEPFWMYDAVEIADLNKDGYQDIAGSRGYFSTSRWKGEVSVLYQDSQNQGSFSFVKRVKTGDLPYCISLDIGDLNGDGSEDMATACTFYRTSNYISIIYQDSIVTGEFLPSKNISIGFIPDCLKIGDLNDDGFNDVIISGSNTSVLYQDSNSPGTYLPIFSLNIDSSSADIGDINGDNYLDLALAREGQIRLLFQDPLSPGNFLPPLSLTSDLRPNLIKLKDIDDDGNVDLIVGNVQNSVSVFIQDPLATGEFLQRDDYPLNRDADDLAIGDLNNDG